jgi:hypothetical protein
MKKAMIVPTVLVLVAGVVTAVAGTAEPSAAAFEDCGKVYSESDCVALRGLFHIRVLRDENGMTRIRSNGEPAVRLSPHAPAAKSLPEGDAFKPFATRIFNLAVAAGSLMREDQGFEHELVTMGEQVVDEVGLYATQKVGLASANPRLWEAGTFRRILERAGASSLPLPELTYKAWEDDTRPFVADPAMPLLGLPESARVLEYCAGAKSIIVAHNNRFGAAWERWSSDPRNRARRTKLLEPFLDRMHDAARFNPLDFESRNRLTHDLWEALQSSGIASELEQLSRSASRVASEAVTETR